MIAKKEREEERATLLAFDSEVFARHLLPPTRSAETHLLVSSPRVCDAMSNQNRQ